MFANPWMLLWLPAAAAPLIIHLWYRQRYREVSWAAMEYLLAAIEKSSRRMRIEQWLLLLVRTLLIVLLLLAIAEPLLRNRNSPLLSQGGIHHIFLLDSSYSMGTRDGSLTIFDRAKRQIADRVGESQSGDGYSLIRMGDRAEVVVGRPSLDVAQFLAELESVSLSQGGADLDTALTAAQKLVDSVNENHNFKQHEIVIVSDLGRTSWAEDRPAKIVAGKLDTQLERLAEGGAIEIVAVGSKQRDNLAVVDLAITNQVATVASPTQFVTILHPFTKQSLLNQKIELWVDGVRVDQKTVDLPADTDTQITFMHQFIEPGSHTVSVRAPEDQLPIDNQRFLALNVKEQIDVLLVRGKRGATRPLLAAIDSSEAVVGPVEVEVVDESRLAEIELDRYDVVFLCNVAQWTHSGGGGGHHSGRSGACRSIQSRFTAIGSKGWRDWDGFEFFACAGRENFLRWRVSFSRPQRLYASDADALERKSANRSDGRADTSILPTRNA